METLPDYLGPDLRIVVIGLNPSPASIRAGYYYAHARNRFWPAVRLAGLAPADFTPGPQALAWLRDHWSIGFTDIVKRPTPGGGDLRAADYRRWTPVLHEHLQRSRPRVAWFNGKGVYEQYLRHGLGEKARPVALGRQARTLAEGTVAFVTPNPSPANAAFDLATLVAWYRQVATAAGVPVAPTADLNQSGP